MANTQNHQKITESEYTYDQKFKQLFQNKKFLAPILKNVVKAYSDLPLPEIESLILTVQSSEEIAAVIGSEDVGKGEEAKPSMTFSLPAGFRIPKIQFMWTCISILKCSGRKIPDIRFPSAAFTTAAECSAGSLQICRMQTTEH